MNREDYKLERLIRQRLNSQHTEFNEAHWHDARKLIEADRIRKRRRRFFFMGTLLATMSCLASLVLFVYLRNNSAASAADRQTSIPADLPERTKAGTVKQTDENSPATAIEKPVVVAGGESNTANTDRAVNNPANPSLPAPEQQAAATETLLNNKRTRQAALRKQAGATATASNDDDAQAATSPLVPAGTPLAKSKSKNLPGTYRAQERSKAGSNRNDAVENTSSLTGPEQGGKLSASNTAGPASSPGEIPPGSETGETISTLQEQAVAMIDPRYVNKVDHNWAPAPDTSVKIPAPLKALKARNSFIGQELGATYFNPGKNIFEPIDLSVGLMYYYHMNKRMGLNAGVFYSRIHQHLPERRFRNSVYDFGKSVSYVSLETKRLDYVEIPLQAFYYPITGHMVRAGISYMYLLQSGDLVTRGGVRTKESGYVNGINDRDLLITLGYTWLGKAPFYFSLTGYYGLNDVSKNNAFGSSQKDRISGVQFSIGYTILHTR